MHIADIRLTFQTLISVIFIHTFIWYGNKQDYESILPALEAVYSGQSVFGTEIISKIPGKKLQVVFCYEAQAFQESGLNNFLQSLR